MATLHMTSGLFSIFIPGKKMAKQPLQSFHLTCARATFNLFPWSQASNHRSHGQHFTITPPSCFLPHLFPSFMLRGKSSLLPFCQTPIKSVDNRHRPAWILCTTSASSSHLYTGAHSFYDLMLDPFYPLHPFSHSCAPCFFLYSYDVGKKKSPPHIRTLPCNTITSLLLTFTFL